MERFDFYIPKEMLEDLRKKEKNTGNPVSSYIRQYIREGLDKEKDNARSRDRDKLPANKG